MAWRVRFIAWLPKIAGSSRAWAAAPADGTLLPGEQAWTPGEGCRSWGGGRGGARYRNHQGLPSLLPVLLRFSFTFMRISRFTCCAWRIWSAV